MTKELTITNPQGHEFQVEQRITEEKPDLELGPITVQDSAILTWDNVGMVVVLLAAVVLTKKLWNISK